MRVAGHGAVPGRGYRRKKLRLAVAIARRPREFEIELDPDESWTVLGEVYRRNPRESVPAELWDVVHLWNICRGDSGMLQLPDEGGAVDQPAWTMDAFSVCTGAEAELREIEKAR